MSTREQLLANIRTQYKQVPSIALVMTVDEYFVGDTDESSIALSQVVIEL